MNNLKALKTIKEECIKHNFCSNCPFGNKNDDCEITKDYPSRWALREENKIIRYFE